MTRRFAFLPILCLLLLAAVPLRAERTEENELQRIKYNNPDLVVDLGVGLWAWPIPMDVNGDGFTDLVVVCEDKPYNGTYVFEHPGTNEKMPVFKKARRISRGIINVQVSYIDGKARVLSPANEYPDFAATGIEKPVKLPLPPNPHPNRLRGNMWKYVDYDGDGNLDILIGIDDWTDYGWDNTFDDEGNWTRGPLRGLLYLCRSTGQMKNGQMEYEKPVLLKDVDGNNLETFGWPCPNMVDWDGDGDLDILCGEFRDTFTYFQNIGTRTEPKYAKGVTVKLDCEQFPGKPLTMDLQMVTPVAFDWTGDGKLDLICGDEDGRVALIENTGKFQDGVPVFLEPKYFQQEADEVKCGALATPVGFDWDGDGDIDIICGNTAGYIMFYENLSGPGVGSGIEGPKWAAPKYLEADGKVIRDIFLAGPKGSIQGPCEQKWGYTTLTVADWDGDGLPDIMANSIWGKIVWFRNIGSRTEPKLAAAQAVEVEWDGPQPRLAYGWMKPEGKALLTQWRTTPVMFDWNGDGLMDLLMLDHEGYFSFFERKLVDGKRLLLPPKRVLVDEAGNPLQLNTKIAGGSGRRKICITDYDGDGRFDFLLNTANANCYRQTKYEDGKWYFKDMGTIDGRAISGHSTSPTVVDFDGNGIPDPLIGAEDGYLYYKKNPRALGAENPWYRKPARHETGAFIVDGFTFSVQELKTDGKAFGNRDYVWKDVPEKFGHRKDSPVLFTQTLGGDNPMISVTAKRDAVLYVLTGPGKTNLDASWKLEHKDALHYTDGGKTKMSIYSRPMKKGETVTVPQSQWTGTIVILKE